MSGYGELLAVQSSIGGVGKPDILCPASGCQPRTLISVIEILCIGMVARNTCISLTFL